MTKRLFDILALILTAPLWLPLLLILGALTWLAMGAPLFFVQERAGRHAQPFKLRKFRTMRPGPEPDDARLTPFGRWLRSTSLDELPELWHILRGEMSLVGPRPLPLRYLARYTPAQMRRHVVRPGLTGWAQINGRNTLTWEQKFAYDLWYVDHCSLWLDLRILGITLWQVATRRNINASNAATMAEFEGTAPETPPNPAVPEPANPMQE